MQWKPPPLYDRVGTIQDRPKISLISVGITVGRIELSCSWKIFRWGGEKGTLHDRLQPEIVKFQKRVQD